MIKSRGNNSQTEIKKRVSFVQTPQADKVFTRQSAPTKRGNKKPSRDDKSAHPSLESIVSDALLSALDDLAQNDTWASPRNSIQKPHKETATKKPLHARSSSFTSRDQREVKPIKSQTFELNVKPKVIRTHLKSCYSSSSFDKTAADFINDDYWPNSTQSSHTTITSVETAPASSNVKRQNNKVKLFDKNKAAAIKRSGSLTIDKRRPAVIKPKLLRRQTMSAPKTDIVVKGNKMKRESKLSVSKDEKLRQKSRTELTELLFLQDDDVTERPVEAPVEQVMAVESEVMPVYAERTDDDREIILPDENESRDKRSALVPTPTKQLQDKVTLEFMSVLNASQLAAFRKLFSRFDQTKSGGISAAELYQAITEMLPGREVSYEEVESVLEEFDIKETGEIEFDEFLFAMTHPRNYLKLMNDEDRGQLEKEIKVWEELVNRRVSEKSSNTINKRQPSTDFNGDKRNIFFTMLKTATRKDSMKEIRHFYVNRLKKLNDHVIHDWSAGQRCIGLSYQEMMKRYEHINRELQDEKSPFARKQAYKNSPYAQPLRWGFNETKDDATKKKWSCGKKVFAVARIKSAAKARTSAPRDEKHVRIKSAVVRRTPSDSSEPPEIQFQDQGDVRRMRLARHGLAVRHKVKEENKEEELQRTYSTPARKVERVNTITRRAASAKKRNAPLRRPRISEFVVTPKVVPLPKYPLQMYPQTFDYDDLPEIRHKAAIILEDYYSDLKKVAATNSRAIYKQLQVEQMRPVSRNHFKKSYLAYSGDYEPFVVSPWIPSPTPSTWIPYPPLGKSQPKQIWT